ncbi:hypothetical protein N7G274_008262 [Stereocaulon virgatum]|uniref:MYND-type domain-containing protein n=1 Tax=Stereocaulon virgatum TaxID=373712 RepID=A0ABR3ZYZ8_9LECA
MASPCAICNAPTTSPCPTCESAYYCSIECAEADRPSHVLLCSTYKIVINKPSSSFRRAILFHAEDWDPIFIWVKCSVGSGYDFKHLAEYMGSNDHTNFVTGHINIQRNPLRNRALCDTIEIIYRENTSVDGLEQNQSVVRALRAALSPHIYDWKGPLVAMKNGGLNKDSHVYLDMDMKDLRDTIDYLEVYDRSPLNRGDVTEKVQGVRINCKGDQIICGQDQYVAVNVPREHPVFRSAIPSISHLIEFPVRVYRYKPDQAWKDSKRNGIYRNSPATFLHVETNLTSGLWGRPPELYYPMRAGSILVVRSDGEDMTIHQAEALGHFVQFKMRRMFAGALGFGSVGITSEAVMAYITPANFRKRFAKLRTRRLASGYEEWRNASLPG